MHGWLLLIIIPQENNYLSRCRAEVNGRVWIIIHYDVGVLLISPHSHFDARGSINEGNLFMLETELPLKIHGNSFNNKHI